MTKDVARRLEQIVAALDDQIKTVRACGFADTAILLASAKLDLQAKIHGISDEELRALSDLLRAGGAERDPGATVIDFAARVSRK
jgi:hypothetical protein